MKNYKFDTLTIHAGQKVDPTTKAIGVPISLTNAYTFDDADQAKNIFALEIAEKEYFLSAISSRTA